MEESSNDGAGNQRSRNLEKLKRDLGPTFLTAFNDSTTLEIVLNPDGRLWQECLGQKMREIGTLSKERAEAVLKTIAACLNTTITREKPTIEGEFPLDGSRFAGQIPPVVQAPTFALRKKAISLFTLDQYFSSGIMNERQLQIIKQAISDHRNIVVMGGTGSGKTTLTNALIAEIVQQFPHERIVIIEDTGEIQCSAVNSVVYHTTTQVDMTALLKTTLRMRPDRILIGEVRGAEALDLLDAWNTGHEGGIVTLHANDSEAGLTRLHSLVSRNPHAPEKIEPLIGEAVHLIVNIAKTETGRTIREILEVSGYVDGCYKTSKIK